MSGEHGEHGERNEKAPDSKTEFVPAQTATSAAAQDAPTIHTTRSTTRLPFVLRLPVASIKHAKAEKLQSSIMAVVHEQLWTATSSGEVSDTTPISVMELAADPSDEIIQSIHQYVAVGGWGFTRTYNKQNPIPNILHLGTKQYVNSINDQRKHYQDEAYRQWQASNME